MKDYSERAEFALTKAESRDVVRQAEVFLGANHLLTIRSAVGKILESKVIQDAGLAVRILTTKDGMGFSSTCDLSDQSIERIIEEAVAIARHREVNPDYSFAAPQKASREHQFCDDDLIEMLFSYEDINEQVNQMLQETVEANPAIKEASGPTHLVHYSKEIRNTNGVEVAEDGTYWNIELMAIAESSADRREGTDSSAGWKISDIDTPGLKEHAVDMAIRSLDGKRVERGQYELILSPMSVSTFIGWLTYLMLPQNLERSYPLLRDKIGEEIVSPLMTVGHDPLKVPSPVSGAYDDEGIPTQDIALIERGVFKQTPLDTFYAAQSQTPSNGMGYRLHTGSGMTNYPGQLYQSEPIPKDPAVYMAGEPHTIENMIAETTHGIFLDFLHYAYVTNGSTGDYTGILRQGTFLVENGEITDAIQKCRLIDNILAMAKNVEMVGVSRMTGNWGEMRHVPPMKISQVDIIPY
ncbi:MAG: TldD/PmbA family protein [Candidatus Thorarchaeota archaeon]